MMVVIEQRMVISIRINHRKMRRAEMIQQGMRVSWRPAQGATPSNRRSHEGRHHVTHRIVPKAN